MHKRLSVFLSVHAKPRGIHTHGCDNKVVSVIVNVESDKHSSIYGINLSDNFIIE